MATILKTLLAVLLALLVLAAVLGGLGSLRWDRETRRVKDAILQQAEAPEPAEPAVAAALPDPVRRYLEWAAPGDRPPIRVARVRQSGEFLLDPPDGWAPFSASQLFTIRPPAMLWDATIRMAPFVSVRVRDSYTAGVGSMHGAVLGLFTVLEESGPTEIAASSLARYLAEAPWFPTRLWPSQALSWAPVDDTTAVATLRAGDVSVTLEFRFDPEGPITTVFAERRFRGESENPMWAPWIGRFSDYEEVDGFRIPGRGVVAWILDGEERPYWRGKIESALFEY